MGSFWWVYSSSWIKVDNVSEEWQQSLTFKAYKQEQKSKLSGFRMHNSEALPQIAKVLKVKCHDATYWVL